MDSHSHHHHHHPTEYNRAFLIGIILNVAFVLIEAVYGLVGHSSALLADAGHNAGDVLSLVFAWAALSLAKRKPTDKKTYGFKKSTILVSLLNATLLFGAISIIAWDAIDKFRNPVEVQADIVMIVAGIGVVINTITALLFLGGQKHDLNIRGAFLHMAADAAVSLGVVIAGLIILKTNILWIDPAISLFIISVILWSNWKLFSESLNLALDGVPKDLKLEKINQRILEIKEVKSIHDLHVWALSTTDSALTAHIVVTTEHTDAMIHEIQEILEKDFEIHHSTLQIETQSAHLHCHSCEK
ncbi:MAG: cation transporter [Bacteroidales bacterium]|nr:cation transporter [Bacteroidales bacterium]